MDPPPSSFLDAFLSSDLGLNCSGGGVGTPSHRVCKCHRPVWCGSTCRSGPECRRWSVNCRSAPRDPWLVGNLYMDDSRAVTCLCVGHCFTVVVGTVAAVNLLRVLSLSPCLCGNEPRSAGHWEAVCPRLGQSENLTHLGPARSGSGMGQNPNGLSGFHLGWGTWGDNSQPPRLSAGEEEASTETVRSGPGGIS